MEDISIVLIGFKGSGKTTIGKQIAEKKNFSFYDLDEEICQSGETAYNILKTYGEEELRRRERRALAALQNEQKKIIATGGGTICDWQCRMLIKKLGKVIYLHAPLSIVSLRILSSPPSHFTDTIHPRFFIEQAYQKRYSLYLTLADYMIETKDKTNRQIILEIEETIDGK